MIGGMVPGVVERGAMLTACFASMLSSLRPAGESLRLGELVGSALSWRGVGGAKPLECGEPSPLLLAGRLGLQSREVLA